MQKRLTPNRWEQAAFTTNYKKRDLDGKSPAVFGGKAFNRIGGKMKKPVSKGHKKARIIKATRTPVAAPPAASSAQRFQPVVKAHRSAMFLHIPAMRARDRKAPVFRALFFMSF